MAGSVDMLELGSDPGGVVRVALRQPELEGALVEIGARMAGFSEAYGREYGEKQEARVRAWRRTGWWV